jgi:hypothetical protein
MAGTSNGGHWRSTLADYGREHLSAYHQGRIVYRLACEAHLQAELCRQPWQLLKQNQAVSFSDI